MPADQIGTTGPTAPIGQVASANEPHGGRIVKWTRVRIAAWAVPVLSFALATILIADRHRAFVDAVRRKPPARIRVEPSYTTEDAIDDSKRAARFACAARNPKEEAVFFAGLRRHAALADVTIVRLRSQAETLGANTPSGPPPDGKDASETITKGVTRIGCSSRSTAPTLRCAGSCAASGNPIGSTR